MVSCAEQIHEQPLKFDVDDRIEFVLHWQLVEDYMEDYRILKWTYDEL